MLRTTAMLALAAGIIGNAASAQEITLWSHWADQASKVEFVENAAKAYEEANPGVTINISWYQKEPLYAALKTALTAAQGPDIFYAESDQTEYMQNDLVLDLSDKLNWDNIEPWATEVWGYEGGVYGFPLEAWTVETYVNNAVMAENGIEIPVAGMEGQAFVDAVQKIADAGTTPLAQGVGDRPYPGAFLTHEILVKKLGTDDYRSLLKGEGVAWSDSRVKEALDYAKQIIDASAFPASFSSIKLGEAHRYFHTSPGAAMLQMGSFYPSRAFAAPDEGGQPDGFDLGIVNGPIPDGAACPECKTIAVGGSFVVNASSENADLAAGFLNSMATPEMGNAWLEANLVGTGIKSDASKITGENADYFQKLAAANEGAKYTFGIPVQQMQGTPRETFTQVINQAFPAGLIGVDEAISMMESAY
ncbi:carbohydrate ABC transporter substrate-binding protein (CUT1 family) [Aliiruegeria haliotis]|uniref:Carbohydrate ABC transporter substrate-binding protein (CUT1 family) n=1 Tax=Aliiruegeria haliotis TaxID=1280846 RepID=A0A2T0RLW2_9RHOB|nr:ABC transporter substrate-binding protein [Aliiruegeria haliotis]PRY22121.1 carbohydrate ABC transporter substrate-binding protein (CUT1 family) [Aliiruegeria haliotis]